MIWAIKIFAIIIGLVVIGKSLLAFKKKEEGIVMFLFWTMTWIGIIFVAIYPLVIDRVGRLVGDSRSSVITFLGFAFVFVLFITYRVYVKANRIEQKLTNLVISISLEGQPCQRKK